MDGDFFNDSDLDVPFHSREEIVWAGRVIAQRRAWTLANEAELIRAFGIAHDWRTLHAGPMQRVRAGLRAKAAHVEPGLALTAGRLKRMQSIRKKLQRSSVTLFQMQDIAGCRAITGSLEAARSLADHFRSSGGYHVRRENDYIAEPKADGYRSHHLMLDFDVDASLLQPLRVELQVRTRLQHAWATAVEAVGAVNGTDLKAGVGDGAWLRFFMLTSAAIAFEEGGPPVPGAPQDAEALRFELVEVERGLDAVRKLESYSHAIREMGQSTNGSGTSYLIKYDNLKREVKVSSWSRFSRAATAYLDVEETGGQMMNAVLVEVDRLEDLRAAYPNYFLDVGMFVAKLKQYLTVGESTVPPLEPRPAGSRRQIDLGWWFGPD